MSQDFNNIHISPADVRLHFRCNQCGNCCRGEGYVFLTDDDIRRLAAYFDMSEAEFLARYTRRLGSGELVLLDHGDARRSCILLHDNLCCAHDAKPMQCRDFPYTWRSPDMSSLCEGWRNMEAKLAKSRPKPRKK